MQPFIWLRPRRCSSVYDTRSELTFVSDREFLQAELLVWNGVFDKVLLTERHEVPHVITQVVHHVPWLSFASSSACGRRILSPRVHVRAAILNDITGKIKKIGMVWIWSLHILFVFYFSFSLRKYLLE